MPTANTLSALLFALLLSAPALAGDQPGGDAPEPTGPVVHEDYCPG